MQDAVYHLNATAGYQNLLSEVRNTSGYPLKAIGMVTRCIKSFWKPAGVLETW